MTVLPFFEVDADDQVRTAAASLGSLAVVADLDNVTLAFAPTPAP